MATWIFWLEISIENKVLSGKHPLITDYDVASVPFEFVKPYKAALKVAYLNPNVDVRVNEIVEKYTNLRPLDPNGWLKGSSMLQRQGNISKSLEYLDKAHRLSKRNSHYLNNVFIRYLELGEMSLAKSVFKDLVILKPAYFAKYFDILSKLTPDYKNLIKDVVVANVSTVRNLPEDYYYQSALRVALKRKNIELADEVWRQMPLNYRFQSKMGLRYLSLINAKHNAKKYSAVWGDLTQRDIKNNSFANSGFEEPQESITPCFSQGEIKGAKWYIGDNGYSSKHSFQIDFDGSKNLNFAHAKCTIAVKPNKTYEFSGVWSGLDITTLSGVYFDVYAVSKKGFYVNTKPLKGTWRWQTFSLMFTAPSDVELVNFRIRRAKTDLLDSKISGSVFIDNISLVEKGR